jgi:hypothetical protein
MQQWAITRNAVKKRARVLGVELIRPDAHTALWPGDALPLGQRYHDHVQAGRLTRDFPELPRSTETTAIAKPATAPGSALVTKQPKPVAAPLAAPEQLAALVAALRPVDPLAVPDALDRAAEAGHWLNAGELAAVMGASTGKVRKLADGETLRPGFTVERLQDAPGKPVWFRVNRSQ